MSNSRLAEPNFRLLFEAGPTLCVALEPDAPRFTIIAVSDAYTRATFTRREEILGRGVFEVLSGNPADPYTAAVLPMRSSLERVLRSRAPDALTFHKFDIRRPPEQGGGFEERWWNPVNSPILGPTGEVLYIVHRVEDVTEFVRLKQAGLRQQRLTDELRERSEQMEAEIFLRSREIEAARQREERELRFLAEAGAILASTLDYEETLTGVARLAVQEFADVCLVDIFEEGGGVRRLRTVSRDPSLAWACDVLTSAPVDRTRPHVMWVAEASKRPVLMEDLASQIELLAHTEERRQALYALAVDSGIVVPLLTHDQVVGEIAFLNSAGSRKFERRDLKLAEAIALRAALAIENTRLYRAAHRAVQDRDDVLGIVAHDLRNSLNAIMLQAKLLDLQRQEPEERSRQRIQAIQRSAARMNRLIQDLVDVARLEAGHSLAVQREAVSVSRLIEDSAEDQKLLTSAAHLNVRLDIPPGLPEVWADRDRVLQILENLVGNAIKFTKAGGHLTLGASAGNGEVTFWVADNGAGIRAEDLPHVFDRFWQARKNERRGAGLGLLIVKALVEAHGGRVWVESAVGRGTTFYFTIPNAEPRRSSPETKAAEP